MAKGERARRGRLAPFLFALRQAKGKSLRQVAEASGVQFQAVALMETTGEGSPARVDKVIAGCGGGARELEDGRLALALDRGSLPLPPDVDERRLRRALRIITGRKKAAILGVRPGEHRRCRLDGEEVRVLGPSDTEPDMHACVVLVAPNWGTLRAPRPGDTVLRDMRSDSWEKIDRGDDEP